jgi:outer membrane scaffolding protein for murein synthesis (MipA/OmpV family)
MKPHLFILCLVAPVLAGGGVARAEDDQRDGLSLSLGAAGVYRPEFKGSKDYEFKPLPFVGLRYGLGDRYVALEGPSLRANVLSGQVLEFGPVISYERGRKKDIKNLAVRRLGEIDAAVNVGAFARKRLKVGAGDLTIGVEALTDTGKVHKGVLATAGVGYDRQLNDRWNVSANLSATWADRKYMRTYYGVSGAGAAASGFSPYVASAGIENVEVGASLSYRISDRWSALALGGYRRLVDSAADSPIVARGGSANQGQVAFALLYNF